MIGLVKLVKLKKTVIGFPFTFPNYLGFISEKTNFPGVGEEYLIDVWSKISPDPNLILKIPKSFFNNKRFQTILKKEKQIFLITYQFLISSFTYA